MVQESLSLFTFPSLKDTLLTISALNVTVASLKLEKKSITIAVHAWSNLGSDGGFTLLADQWGVRKSRTDRSPWRNCRWLRIPDSARALCEIENLPTFENCACMHSPCASRSTGQSRKGTGYWPCSWYIPYLLRFGSLASEVAQQLRPA